MKAGRLRLNFDDQAGELRFEGDPFGPAGVVTLTMGESVEMLADGADPRRLVELSVGASRLADTGWSVADADRVALYRVLGRTSVERALTTDLAGSATPTRLSDRIDREVAGAALHSTTIDTISDAALRSLATLDWVASVAGTGLASGAAAVGSAITRALAVVGDDPAVVERWGGPGLERSLLVCAGLVHAVDERRLLLDLVEACPQRRAPRVRRGDEPAGRQQLMAGDGKAGRAGGDPTEIGFAPGLVPDERRRDVLRAGLEADRTGEEIQVRYRPGGLPPGLWIRVVPTDDSVVPLIVPLHPDGDELAATVFAPQAIVGECRIEITDRPGRGGVAPRVAEIDLAIDAGRRAGRAHRLRDDDLAGAYWVLCADRWEALGDDQRAHEARSFLGPERPVRSVAGLGWTDQTLHALPAALRDRAQEPFVADSSPTAGVEPGESKALEGVRGVARKSGCVELFDGVVSALTVRGLHPHATPASVTFDLGEYRRMFSIEPLQDALEMRYASDEIARIFDLDPKQLRDELGPSWREVGPIQFPEVLAVWLKFLDSHGHRPLR